MAVAEEAELACPHQPGNNNFDGSGQIRRASPGNNNGKMGPQLGSIWPGTNNGQASDQLQKTGPEKRTASY